MVSFSYKRRAEAGKIIDNLEKNGGRGRESNPPIPFKGDNRF